MARICDNTLLNSGDSSSSETFAGLFQRNLLRRVQNTALRLEDAVNEWVTNSESCLSNFVSKHWADADQGQIGFWERYTSPCERWWKATFEHKSGRKMTLQIDINFARLFSCRWMSSSSPSYHNHQSPGLREGVWQACISSAASRR